MTKVEENESKEKKVKMKKKTKQKKQEKDDGPRPSADARKAAPHALSSSRTTKYSYKERERTNERR